MGRGTKALEFEKPIQKLLYIERYIKGSVGFFDGLLIDTNKYLAVTLKLLKTNSMAVNVSIFGDDDRIRLNDNERNSFTAQVTVRITSKWADGYTVFGTGILVGDNDVLTAAHVVYTSRHGGLASEIQVAPAYQLGPSRWGIQNAESVTPFATNWSINGVADDLAIVHVAPAIGRQIGWVTPGGSSANASGYLGQNLQAIGYPSDIENGEVLVSTEGTVDDVNAGLLIFRDDLDLGAGQSGSGLLSFDKVNNPKLEAVLLGYRLTNTGVRENIARKIDATVSDWIAATTNSLSSWSVNLNDIGHKVGRLYIGIFDRLPDEGGLNYWIGRANAESTLTSIAREFLYSAEFKQKYGDFSLLKNSDFVSMVYSTLLHRSPDQSGMNYWVNRMVNGLSQPDLIVEFSESYEAIYNTSVFLTGIHQAETGDWMLQ